MRRIKFLFIGLGFVMTNKSIMAMDPKDFGYPNSQYRRGFYQEQNDAPETNYAINRYYPEVRSLSVDSLDLTNMFELKDRICSFNELSFFDFNESTPNYEGIKNFICNAYLGTIRTLDFSDASTLDVDGFLKELIIHNRTLRSLVRIKVTDTNVSTETLMALKNQIQFDSLLIRDMSVISGRTGWNVALIYIEIRGTSILKADFSEKVELQKPTDRTFDIFYRASNDTSTAHLQLVFE